MIHCYLSIIEWLLLISDQWCNSDKIYSAECCHLVPWNVLMPLLTRGWPVTCLNKPCKYYVALGTNTRTSCWWHLVVTARNLPPVALFTFSLMSPGGRKRQHVTLTHSVPGTEYGGPRHYQVSWCPRFLCHKPSTDNELIWHDLVIREDEF